VRSLALGSIDGKCCLVASALADIDRKSHPAAAMVLAKMEWDLPLVGELALATMDWKFCPVVASVLAGMDREYWTVLGSAKRSMEVTIFLS